MEEKKYYTLQLHNEIYDEAITLKLSHKEYAFLTWFINEVTHSQDEFWLIPVEEDKCFEFES